MAMKKKTVAILQSNYIPWKGYFDIMNSVDEFIVCDFLQYTVRDWRNRNRIKTPQGSAWLTIPVAARNHMQLRIDEVQTSGTAWRKKHWKALAFNYGRSPFFEYFREQLEPWYLGSEETCLSVINVELLRVIAAALGIRTPIIALRGPHPPEGKTERLVRLCLEAGATAYLSGPAARAYIDEALFADNGLQLCWMDYSNYPEYRQLFPPFEHGVTVLDLLFNTGPDAPLYMKSFHR